MRTRTRSLSGPAGCTVTGLQETFIDNPTPCKLWKPCTHTSNKVIAFSPGFVSLTGYGFDYSFQAGGPGYTWAASGWTGWIEEFPDPSPPPQLAAINTSAIIADLSRSSTNLAEVIATMTDTVRLFSGPARFLKHAARKGIPVSKKPLKELRDSLDRAGETWLAGTYGYIPLVHDLVELTSICRAPSKSLSKLKKPIVKDVRSSASQSWSSKPRPSYPRYNLGQDTWLQSSEHLEVTQSLSRLVRITGIPNPSFQAMSLANQMATYLGLNDFGRLAWELVPFSFVFDWFSSLGSNVASCSALNGHYAYIGGTVSSAQLVKTTSVYTGKGPLETSQGPYGIVVTPYSCTVENTTFTRTDVGAGDTSGATFTNGLNSYRTASGLALLLGSMGHLTGW